MATNIEIKATYEDLEHAKRICGLLAAKYIGTDLQLDTYFKVHSGKLKLRESTLSKNQLIFYNREIKYDAKRSDYFLVPIEGEPAPLRCLLSYALGVIAQVQKTRDIFIIACTRIHLDNVESLGKFIEFEYLINNSNSMENGIKELDQIRERFDIQESNLIDVSYSDLLQKNADS